MGDTEGLVSQNLEWGMLMQIVPNPKICHVSKFQGSSYCLHYIYNAENVLTDFISIVA